MRKLVIVCNTNYSFTTRQTLKNLLICKVRKKAEYILELAGLNYEFFGPILHKIH